MSLMATWHRRSMCWRVVSLTWFIFWDKKKSLQGQGHVSATWIPTKIRGMSLLNACRVCWSRWVDMSCHGFCSPAANCRLWGQQPSSCFWTAKLYDVNSIIAIYMWQDNQESAGVDSADRPESCCVHQAASPVGVTTTYCTKSHTNIRAKNLATLCITIELDVLVSCYREIENCGLSHVDENSFSGTTELQVMWVTPDFIIRTSHEQLFSSARTECVMYHDDISMFFFQIYFTLSTQYSSSRHISSSGQSRRVVRSILIFSLEFCTKQWSICNSTKLASVLMNKHYMLKR